jgi:hypothetical protein
MKYMVALLWFCSVCVGLHHGDNESRLPPLLHTPTLELSFNYTPPLSEDASTKRLTSFFKLAHSRVTLESDIRATAAGLVPLYNQLCASVPDCYAGVMELLADHQTELRLATDRMDRLHLVLNRVRRLANGGDKLKPHHRGLWRRPLKHTET